MDLKPFQQATEVINRSKSILVCLPLHPSSDAISSGLALLLALEKLGKRVRVVCSEFELPSNHSFLPKSDAIERELSNLRQFIISVDITKAAIDELSYNIEGGKLNVYLTPRDGFYEAKDVTTSTGEFAYNLAIIVDAGDLEALGPIAVNNAEFFYRTPILNIDHTAKNTMFGAVNLVDLTATSTSEIAFELIKAIGFNVLDEKIATTLLTGIISKTKSFQTPTVTPRSLAIASHLIAAGAKRDDIINNLYQSKSIASLKLWGRALARLQQDHRGQFVWSVLNEQDFIRSGAVEQDLPNVIDELITNIPTAELVVILYQRERAGITALVHATKGLAMRETFPEGSVNENGTTVTWRTPFQDLTVAETEIRNRVNRLFSGTSA